MKISKLQDDFCTLQQQATYLEIEVCQLNHKSRGFAEIVTASVDLIAFLARWLLRERALDDNVAPIISAWVC